MVKLSKKFPIIAGIAGVLLFFIVQTVTSLAVYGIKKPAYLSTLIIDLACTVLGVVLILVCGLGDIFKDHRESFLRGLCTGGFFIFVSASSLVILISSAKSRTPLSSTEIAVFVLAMVAIGFAEELLFRGFVSEIIFRKYGNDFCGVWFSTIVSSLIFGAAHLVNAFSSDFGGVVIQSVGAFAMGLGFTAVYYRTRNVYVTAALHAFMDFAALFTTGVFGDGTISTTVSSYDASKLLAVPIYVLVAVVLLRKLKMARILGKPEDTPLTMLAKLSSSEKSKNRLKWLLVGIALTAIAVYAFYIIKAALNF